MTQGTTNAAGAGNLLAPPAPVTAKLAELNTLCEKHPVYLPLSTVADFLGCDDEGLRHSILCGQCSFGIGWRKSENGYAGFKIPTATFYLWYTQAATMRGV